MKNTHEKTIEFRFFQKKMNLDFSKTKAVIFDMDGVLVNSEPFYVAVEKQNFKKLGLTISNEEHHTYQGTATDRMWQIIIEKHGLKQSLEELVEMSDSIVIPYFQQLETIETMPGVEKLIRKLYRKFPLALASSSTPEVIEIILQKTGFKKYFKTVVDSRMAGASKPDPGIFRMAAKKLEIPPENCLVIEDSTNGIRAANRAGMMCVAYSGPGSENQDQSAADLIVTDFGELELFFQKAGF